MKKKIYLEIYMDLKNKIEKNLITNKLLSIRKLAKELAVNPSTVFRAYLELEKNGFIYSKEGSGYFVIKSNKNKPFLEDHFEKDLFNYNNLQSECLIDFASATPNQSILPMKNIQKAIQTVLERDKERSFFYGNTKGFLELRKSIANFFNEKTLYKILPENIQLISGAQQGIDLITESILTSNDKVVIEEPTYRGARDSLKKVGCKIFSIPMEDDGFSLTELKKILKTDKIKLFYTMTNFQNPTGISTSAEKKEALLKLAKKHNFYILEDDGLSDIFFEGNEPTTLKVLDKFEKVIYIKSYSKIFMPGLRLAYMIIPQATRNKSLFNRLSGKIYHFGLMQRAFQEFLMNGDLKKHIEVARSVFKKKQKIMSRELLNIKNITYIIPKGGLSFWIKLPKNISGRFIYHYLLSKSVCIVPGIFFSNSKENYIRISFAQCEEEEIIDGIKFLNEAIIYFEQP